MRRLAILTFVTVDGVMQGPSSPDEDPSGGFTSGGWAAPYWEEVMSQVMEEAMGAPYDLLLGRKTYDLFAAHWPNAGDNPVANRLNGATKYVATSAAGELAWQKTERITGDVAAEVARIKAQDGPLLQVHGSWQLIQTLLSHRLIDEFRVWTFPVIVGSGKRLFDDGSALTDLELVKSASTSNGTTMSIYRLADTRPA